MKSAKLFFALLMTFFILAGSLVQAQEPRKRMSGKTKGTLIGAGTGAVGGAVLGGGNGAVIGAAAGAVGGRILGKRSDRRRAAGVRR